MKWGNSSLALVALAAAVWYFFVRSGSQFSLAVVSANAGTTTPKLAHHFQGSGNLSPESAHYHRAPWGARSQGSNDMIQQRG